MHADSEASKNWGRSRWVRAKTILTLCQSPCLRLFFADLLSGFANLLNLDVSRDGRRDQDVAVISDLNREHEQGPPSANDSGSGRHPAFSDGPQIMNRQVRGRYAFVNINLR